MIVSTKGRYALSVLIDLAEHPTDGYVPLAEISERIHISKEYLNSILKILVQGKQLASLRGKGGGYRLMESPENVCIGTVLRLVEGDLAPVSCVQENHRCPNCSGCRSYAMWEELDTLINGYLDQVYLSDFLGNGRFHRS